MAFQLFAVGDRDAAFSLHNQWADRNNTFATGIYGARLSQVKL
jgi:hypothetical protein